MPSVSPSRITYFADTTLNLKHLPPPCDSGNILLQDDYQRGLDADREEQGKLHSDGCISPCPGHIDLLATDLESYVPPNIALLEYQCSELATALSVVRGLKNAFCGRDTTLAIRLFGSAETLVAIRIEEIAEDVFGEGSEHNGGIIRVVLTHRIYGQLHCYFHRAADQGTPNAPFDSHLSWDMELKNSLNSRLFNGIRKTTPYIDGKLKEVERS